MASIPFTKEDFIRYGERFNSEDLLQQADTLIPLAEAHIQDVFGYDQRMLDELKALRASLEEAAASRDIHRQQQKKGSRVVEQRLIKEAKLLHRDAISVLKNAMRSRIPPEGETEDQTRTIFNRLGTALDAQARSLGNSSQQVSIRMKGLLSLITDPGIAPRFEELAGGEDLQGQVESLISRLEEATQTKEASQQEAILDTAEQNELDGRLYNNLKALVEAGRSSFKRLGDPQRASLFNLDELYHRTLNDPSSSDSDQGGEDHVQGDGE